jgi:ABC-type transport system substrate-binding protein
MAARGPRSIPSKRLAAAGIALLMLVAACSGDGDTGSGGEASGDVDPNAVLRVGANLLTEQGASVDPRFSRNNGDLYFMQALYSPMLTYEPGANEPSPNLAGSYEVADPQTVEITLRDDALFHDGSPVTSEDVRATVEVAKANTAEGITTLNPAIALVQEVEVVDDKTFVVHLSQPAVAALIEMLTDRPFMVMPASTTGEEQTAPIGTGPFRLASFSAGESIVLEKFEDHWLADQVQLAGVQFVHMAEGQPMNNALLAGDIDYGQLDLAGLQSVEGNDAFGTETLYSDGQMIYLDMCKDFSSLFEDARVRRAVAYAIDESVVNESVYDGLGQPADTQLWPSDTPEYDEDLGDPYPYDPDRAEELLAEAGAEGESVSIYQLNQFSSFRETALIIQQQLEEVGLEVEVAGGDDIVGDYWAPANAGSPSYDSMVVRNQRTGVQKATRWFTEGSQANTCGWADRELTGLVSQIGGLEPGTDDSVSAWHDLQQLVAEDVVLLPLLFEPEFVGWSTRVQGVEDALVWPNIGMGPRWDLIGLTG